MRLLDKHLREQEVTWASFHLMKQAKRETKLYAWKKFGKKLWPWIKQDKNYTGSKRYVLTMSTWMRQLSISTINWQILLMKMLQFRLIQRLKLTTVLLQEIKSWAKPSLETMESRLTVDNKIYWVQQEVRANLMLVWQKPWANLTKQLQVSRGLKVLQFWRKCPTSPSC